MLVSGDTLAVYAAGTVKGDRLQVHRFIGINNTSGSIIILLYCINSWLYILIFLSDLDLRFPITLSASYAKTVAMHEEAIASWVCKYFNLWGSSENNTHPTVTAGRIAAWAQYGMPFR